MMHQTVTSSAGTTLPEWQADEVLEEFRQLLEKPPETMACRNAGRKRKRIRERVLSLFYLLVVTLSCSLLFLHELKLRQQEDAGSNTAIIPLNDTGITPF